MRTFPALLHRRLVLGNLEFGFFFRLEYSQVAFSYILGLSFFPACTISNERIMLFFSPLFLQHWTQRAHKGRDKISPWNAAWIHAGLHSQFWGEQEKHPTRRRSRTEQKEEEEECAWDTLMKSPEGAGKAVLGIISPLWTLKKKPQRQSLETRKEQSWGSCLQGSAFGTSVLKEIINWHLETEPQSI